MKLRLSDPDRARLGCPEWLEYDRDQLDLADAEALEAAGGRWFDYAESTLAGSRARVWIALHRAGVTVTPYESLHFDVLGITYEDMPAPSPGKAPSKRSGPRTRSTSAASGRRTRSKT